MLLFLAKPSNGCPPRTLSQSLYSDPQSPMSSALPPWLYLPLLFLWFTPVQSQWPYWCSSHMPSAQPPHVLCPRHYLQLQLPSWLTPSLPSNLCSNVISLRRPALTALFKLQHHGPREYSSKRSQSETERQYHMMSLICGI